MTRPSWLKEAVKIGKDFHINTRKKSTHNMINLTCAIVLWSSIFGILWAGVVLTPLWYPLLGILLSAAFFGNFILMIHECSHNMFVSVKDVHKNKELNSFIGRLSSIPFITAYKEHWEDGHVIHHLRPCESDDPQNPDPLDGKRLLRKLLIIVLLPFGFVTANPSKNYDGKIKRLFLAGLFWGPIVSFMWQQNPLSLCVLYLGLTGVACLNLLKIVQEHGSGLATLSDPLLRSRTYHYPLSWLFSPFNIHYHFEHHANFMVPWYLLPRYHQQIINIIPPEYLPWIVHSQYFKQAKGQFSIEVLKKITSP